MTGVLNVGEYLSPGESLVSDNGNYELILQTDGNLVIYYKGGGASTAVWATMTEGKGSQKLTLSPTSNLVLTNGAGATVWSSGSLGRGYGPTLVMQDDGNLVIYATPAVWDTGTNGKT